MKSLKSAIAGVASLAVVGAGLFLGAGAAHAVGTVDPAITGDANASNGTIAFYDASGNRITSGQLGAPFAAYAVASSATTKSGTTKATLFVATPDHTKPNSLNWFNQQLTAASTWPLTSPPANVAAAETAGVPAVKVASTDGNLGGAFAGAVNDPTTGYDHIMQIRMEDSGVGISPGAPFWATDVWIDSTNNTWTQVFPNVASTSVSSVTASPVSPAPQGTTSVSLSATVSASDASHPAGSVELFNGSTDLGAATFTAATGAVTATATVADSTSYSFTFKFTPSGNYTGSTSPALAYSVKGPAVATTTVVSGPTTGTVGSPVAYTATVTPASGTTSPAGTVQFKVNGTNSGNAVTVSAGSANFSYTPTTTDGGHNVVVTAAFTPADATAFNASSDNTGVTTAVAAAAYAPDSGNVTATVPAGTLVISTPYTAANPFNLGTLTLSSDGTHYSASAAFGDPAAPATTDPGKLPAGSTPPYAASAISNGVTITDTRAASTGWTASLSSTNFTNTGPSSISASLFSFTSVAPKAISGNNLQASDITATPVNNLATGGAFAKTTKGPGTIAITGVLGLTNVPTSVQPGTYTATLTFTIA